MIQRYGCFAVLQAAKDGDYVKHDDHQQAVATLEAKVGRLQWQPIETAPKDGTRVLLYANLRRASLSGHDLDKDYGYWIVLGSWEAEYGLWVDGSQCNPLPTHWMPLPEPPQEQPHAS